MKLSNRNILLDRYTIDVYFDDREVSQEFAEEELDKFLSELSEFIDKNKPECLDVGY